MATAIFEPKSDSHPFEKRIVSLKGRVKIGRVLKASPSNSPIDLLFECKVLSRNHALIWYENRKFFIQDTKSSNGTFVNSVCLSRGSEQSDPVEIKSGDVIQFGVNVTDSSKSSGGEKVSHNCIIASVSLFHPDGKQADGYKEDPWGHLVNSEIKAQELWQLSQSLQDALTREQMLENKLATLQRVIDNSVNATDNTWQGLIEEEKLLTRLNALENELEIVTQDLPEDDVRLKIVNLHKEKEDYELKAKEMVEESIKEQEMIKGKLNDAERSLSNSEDECTELRTALEKSQNEVQELLIKYKENLDDMTSLQSQAAEARSNHDNALEKANTEIATFKSELNTAEKRGSALAVEVESLQAECDFMQNQLAAIKDRFEKQQELQQETVEADSLETESELTTLRQENIDLVAKVAMLEAEKQTEKADVTSSINEQHVMSSSKDERESSMMNYIDGLQKLRDMLVNLQFSSERSIDGVNDNDNSDRFEIDSKQKQQHKINGDSLVNGEETDHDNTARDLIEACCQSGGILKDRLTEVNKQCRNITEENQKLQDEITDIQAANSKLNDQSISLQKLLGGEEMKIESLETTISGMKETIAANEQAKKKLDEELALLKHEHETEMSHRSSRERDAAAEVASARSEMDSLTTKADELSAEVKRLVDANEALVVEKDRLVLECDQLRQEKSASVISPLNEAHSSVTRRKTPKAEASRGDSETQDKLTTAQETTETSSQTMQQQQQQQQQQQSQLNPLLSNRHLIDFLLVVLLISVLFIAMLFMDIVKVVPGKSPLFNANAWNEAWNTIF